MVGIYMYENKKTHKKYIGQSSQIERRFNEHLWSPSKYSYFDMELKKIGIEQFTFTILEQCQIEELNEREKYWINYYDSYNSGYNLTPGGQNYIGEANPGAKLTEIEVKEIITLLEQGQLNNKEIAQRYKVHRNTVDFINRCKTWTHLHNYKNNIRQENLDKLDNPHSSFAGTNNPCSKITEEKAIQIIDLIKNSSNSLAQIARDLGVKDSLVYDINRCRTWTYLHNYNKNIRKEYRKEVMP